MNTYDPRVLARMFAERHGDECPLTSSEILTIWRSTRIGTAKGRGIPREQLDARAERTLELMARGK